MPSSIAATRQWRSRTGLMRFIESLEAWYELRRGRDTRQQYATALAAIRTELLATTTRLSAFLERSGVTTGETYAHCARCDDAVNWLYRVFAFFRDKFDQRDDEELRDTLLAADEVVWSVFRAFAGSVGEPAPLVYIDPQYSPASVRRDRSLAALVDRGSGYEFLRDYLQTLPIPVLRLPIQAVQEPWTLVLIGHEAGHLVEPLVAVDFAGRFAALVTEVAESAGATADEVVEWGACAPEIFADWYSVGVMGPWALWAMAQFELGGEPAMRRRRWDAGYPSAVVRLELLRQLADRASAAGKALGSEVAAMLDVPLSLAPGSTDAEGRDRTVATALATRLHAEPLGAHGSMAEAVGNDPAVFNSQVERWSGILTGDFGGQPRRRLEEARQIAAAAARTVAYAQHPDDASRETFTTALRKTAFQTIVQSAVEGKRAGAKAITLPDPGAQLSSMLLGLDLPPEPAQP